MSRSLRIAKKFFTFKGGNGFDKCLDEVFHVFLNKKIYFAPKAKNRTLYGTL